MKLLFFTRKVDPRDSRTSFVIDWIETLARDLEHLTVITWQESSYVSPSAKITIKQLPKNKLVRVIALQLVLLKELSGSRGIFCHMNPEYTIVAAPLARLMGKKVVTWYTHGAVSFRLRLVKLLATKILTASKESFALDSPKLEVTGHGINTELFSPTSRAFGAGKVVELVSVGRISPTKDCESMIKAVQALVDEGRNVNLTFYGAPGLATDEVYYESLKEMVKNSQLTDRITFAGAVPHAQIISRLHVADILLNLSATHSLDKAILEAMATRCLVVTSNKAFKAFLPAELLVENNNPEALAQKIAALIDMPAIEREAIKKTLREIVVANHNLTNLGKKIVRAFV